jgi:L-ascorbate metabolism protein UlaG (beta-lactamase superfamily)
MKRACLCLLITLNWAIYAQTVELTYLGNEGVFLSDGTTNILIDALFLEDFDTYQLVPRSLQEQIITGQGPFRKIHYFLVTHRHDDHFNPGLIKRFAYHHPETRLVSSAQVLNLLKDEGLKEDTMIEIEAGMNQPFSKVPGLQAGIFTAWIRHPHQRNHDVVNLTFLIELSGSRIIHFGDTEFIEENFKNLNLPSYQPDLALVPVWFFNVPSAAEQLGRLIGAKEYLGIHTSRDSKSNFMVMDQPGKTIIVGKPGK